MNLAALRSPSAAMTPAQKRRAAWLALWAFLKGAESLIGHLAERVKIRALQPDPEVPSPDTGADASEVRP